MGYIHVEIDTHQSSKKPDTPCGDVAVFDRTVASTTTVVCDGLGSGIKANIAATMCASRLLESFRGGFSLRVGFANMVRTMNEARGTDLPYSVFTVARVLNDGTTTVLSYEMPGPILVGPRQAVALPQRTLTLENSLIGECHCHMEPGEGILVVSDGISQAGMGTSMRMGWEIEGVCRYINACLVDGIHVREIPQYIHRRAVELWGPRQGDDCTVNLAFCRWGKTVNIFTGPPSDPGRDAEVVSKFFLAEGAKVVCGGTTAGIVARQRGMKLTVEEDCQSLVAPPKYLIEGIDLVTEGAVTLNQVYNILDEDPESFEEDSGVTELYQLLKSADRVNFLMGVARNPASENIAFRQRGILTRTRIVDLLAEKLRKAGKLVVIDYM
jgi:hypothetical protein